MFTIDPFDLIQIVFKFKMALIAQFNKSTSVEVQTELARTVLDLHDLETALIISYNDTFVQLTRTPA